MQKFFMGKVRSIIPILLVIAIFTSCSEIPSNLEVIPKESNFVAAIDVFSIATKCRLDKLLNIEVVKETINEIGLNTDESKVGVFFQKVMENPLGSGVDFTGDIYVFNATENLKKPTFGVSIQIANKNEFNTFIIGLSTSYKNGSGIETKHGVNFVKLANDLHIGWDQDKAILLKTTDRSFSNSLREKIVSLMNLSDENKIVSNEAFNTYHKNKKDLSVWVSSNLIANEYKFKKLVDQVGFKLNDIYFFANIEFKDDQIQLSTDFIPNKSYKKMLEKSEQLSIPFNEEVVGMFSNNYKGLFSVALDFSKISDLYSDASSKKVLEEVGDKMSAFGGSFLVNLYDIEVYGKTKHNYLSNRQQLTEGVKANLSIGFDIRSRLTLDSLINQIVEMNICEAKGKYFVGSFGQEFRFSFGVNGDLGMISMDEAYVRQFTGNEKPKNGLMEESVMSDIKDHAFYSHIKLDVEEYSDEFQKYVSRQDFTPNKTGFTAYGKLFKSMELKRLSATKMELHINFKESGDNALQDLINVTNQIYIEMM